MKYEGDFLCRSTIDFSPPWSPPPLLSRPAERSPPSSCQFDFFRTVSDRPSCPGFFGFPLKPSTLSIYVAHLRRPPPIPPSCQFILPPFVLTSPADWRPPLKSPVGLRIRLSLKPLFVLLTPFIMKRRSFQIVLRLFLPASILGHEWCRKFCHRLV